MVVSESTSPLSSALCTPRAPRSTYIKQRDPANSNHPNAKTNPFEFVSQKTGEFVRQESAKLLI